MTVTTLKVSGDKETLLDDRIGMPAFTSYLRRASTGTLFSVIKADDIPLRSYWQMKDPPYSFREKFVRRCVTILEILNGESLKITNNRGLEITRNKSLADYTALCGTDIILFTSEDLFAPEDLFASEENEELHGIMHTILIDALRREGARVDEMKMVTKRATVEAHDFRIQPGRYGRPLNYRALMSLDFNDQEDFNWFIEFLKTPAFSEPYKKIANSLTVEGLSGARDRLVNSIQCNLKESPQLFSAGFPALVITLRSWSGRTIIVVGAAPANAADNRGKLIAVLRSGFHGEDQAMKVVDEAIQQMWLYIVSYPGGTTIRMTEHWLEQIRKEWDSKSVKSWRVDLNVTFDSCSDPKTH